MLARVLHPRAPILGRDVNNTLKQEHVGPIGDGVKQGSPPAVGLGGANVQMRALPAHI